MSQALSPAVSMIKPASPSTAQFQKFGSISADTAPGQIPMQLVQDGMNGMSVIPVLGDPHMGSFMNPIYWMPTMASNPMNMNQVPQGMPVQSPLFHANSGFARQPTHLPPGLGGPRLNIPMQAPLNQGMSSTLESTFKPPPEYLARMMNNRNAMSIPPTQGPPYAIPPNHGPRVSFPQNPPYPGLY